MISNKNNSKIALLQRLITMICMIITACCGVFAGFYGTGFELFRKHENLVYVTRQTLLPIEEYIVELSQVFDRELGLTKVKPQEFKVEAEIEIVQAEAEPEIIVASQILDTIREEPKLTVAVQTKQVASPRLKAVPQAQAEGGGLSEVRKAIESKNYARATELLRGMPRSNEVNYYRAKVVFGLYLREEATGQQVVSAWDGVRRSNPAGSRMYNEADSILQLFGK